MRARRRRTAMGAAGLGLLALACAAGTAAGAQSPGAAIFAGKGRCAACHQVPPGAGPATRADLGPALDGKRMRALGRERLRALLVDPMANNPDTLMPPYGRHRILAPDEIDRVVEYLDALP